MTDADPTTRQTMKLYPIQTDLKVHITDGRQVGSVTFNGGLHKYIAEDDMPEIIDRVKAALPDGFRLMTRQESMMYFLREEKGYRGSNLVPPSMEKGTEWHDPDAQDSYSDLGNEPDVEGDDE